MSSLACLVTDCVHVKHVASDIDQLYSCIIHVIGLTLTFYYSIVYSFKLAKWCKIVYSNEVEILHTKSSMTILMVVNLLQFTANSIQFAY